MNQSIKKLLPHLIVLVVFIITSLVYFSPVLEGKQIFQNDIKHHNGMAKQQRDFRAQTGEETYWTNSAFGGMPTYQLGARYPHNYIKSLDSTLRFLPRPADYLFLYFIGFYILLLVLKVDYKLAALGAFAFGFSTYLVIILGVGHNSKAHAIAYMPLVLSGIILTFRKQYIWGFLLTATAMALEIGTNHFQMTFYLMLLVIVLGIAYLIDAYRKKMLPHFFKSIGILVAAVVLSIGLNATNLMATQEYVKESTRGKSELTINPDGSKKEITNGLDKEYITRYSYGIVESFNLFIPRFMGGGTYEDVGKDSNTYKLFKEIGASPVQAKNEVKQTPTYWGKQPIVEAPAYIGAVILFLFVLALFLVKGRLKWWLVGGTLLSWILSWGKNWFWGAHGNPENNPITNFMIDYFPLYDKFRAVSSIQVILELCIPILAIFGLSRLFNEYQKNEDKLKALKYTLGITGGIAVLFLLFKGSLFEFVGLRDGQFSQMYGEIGPRYIEAVKADRISIFNSDTVRTLILVLLSAGTIWAFLKNKLSEIIVVVVFAGLILFDLVGVDRRYVNNDDFVSARQIKQPFQANAADLTILKDKSHFKVLDESGDPLNSGRASFFHNALGGYHAAKPRRVEDVMSYRNEKNNMTILNMMNVKYIIRSTEEGPVALQNPDVNGNAWFVEKLNTVDIADDEIKALDNLNTKQEAFTAGEWFKSKPKESYSKDSLAVIDLNDVKPNYLKYTSSNSNNGFAVFSENYYQDGWNAYINGEPQPHYRVNYVLRGMPIPKGNHIIEFKFEPKVVQNGSKVALGSSLLLGLLILSGLYFEFKKKSKT